MSHQLRKARNADLPSIIAMDHVVPLDPFREIFIRNAVGSGTAFVAESNERVVAYSVLDHAFFSRAFISMVYTEERARRQGVASAMIRFLESQCRTDRIFTSTNQSNQPMQVLLERLGFARSGCIENLDDGDPEIVYCKRLKPQNVTPMKVENTIPVLPVSNLKQSIRFYTETLGFTLDWSGTIVCGVSRDGHSIMLWEEIHPCTPAKVWIGLQDHSLFDEYRSGGVKVHQEPRNEVWAYEMKFEDPDGNILWLGTETRKDLPLDT